MVLASLPHGRRFTLALASGMAAFVFGPAVDAAVLAQYTFEQGDPAVFTLDATSTAANTNATAITASPQGTSPDTGVTLISESETPGFRIDVTSSNNGETEAANENAYFSFTLTPASGFAFDLDSISIDIQRGGSTGTRGGFVRTSLDGFASTVGSVMSASSAFVVETRDFPDTPTYNNVTEPVTIRVYTISGGGTFSRSVHYDDITVNGSVIPEPASLALAALGGLMIVARPRKRD